MNKYILSIVILLLTLTSCKKEEPVKEKDIYDYYDGQLIIKKNGKDWKPKLLVISDNKIRFGMHIDDYRDGFSWDRIGIGPIPLKLGTYEIIDQKIWDTTTSVVVRAMPAADYNGSFNQGSDVPSPNYLRMDRPHFISVSNYDSVNNRVSGIFSLSFIRDSEWSPLGVGLDTVSYIEASFSATIWNPDELPK